MTTINDSIINEDMEDTRDIQALDNDFDYSAVPDWYTLCFNADCPLRGDCLRFLTGSHAPETLESSRCVLPHTLKSGQCRWFDKIEVVTMAAGFARLYDRVLKRDYTPMRKSITALLIGTRQYYEFKRGERGLDPGRQEAIRRIVRGFGYDWDVPFDRYYKAYRFGPPPVKQ